MIIFLQSPHSVNPSLLLTGTGTAVGIALINSVGCLPGCLGSSVVGWLKDLTGKTSAGLYVLDELEVLAAVLTQRNESVHQARTGIAAQPSCRRRS